MLGTGSYQFIAVSRPGYLRTPLSTGETFEARADAYAALLDQIGIDKVAVIAVSGGGPSALQFALRHPDRCWGLVMLSAHSDVRAGVEIPSGSPATVSPRHPPEFLMNAAFSDFAGWVLIDLAKLMPRPFLDNLIGAVYDGGYFCSPFRQAACVLIILMSGQPVAKSQLSCI